MIDPGMMTSVSLEDVAASGLLLTMLASLMGGATFLAALSSFIHTREKMRVLRSLVADPGAKESLWCGTSR